jgi:hypothetical protein
MQDFKFWVVSADMGYGHQRATFPFKDFAEEKIISIGTDEYTSEKVKRQWSRMQGAYEFLSRFKSVPVLGRQVYKLMDGLLHIPSFYPFRNLSKSTFQVDILERYIRKGLYQNMQAKLQTRHIPLLTSFYAPAIAADISGFPNVYLIICDADINRVWVAKYPDESRIVYFAPCRRIAKRLQAYGVSPQQIHLTGFPFDLSILGNRDLDILKQDFGQRLFYLDPELKFWNLHGRNVEYFLGKENCSPRRLRKLTVVYAVGGAGAQKETGRKIAKSLRQKRKDNELRLVLVAGTRRDVYEYFCQVKEDLGSDNLDILYDDNKDGYFEKFNQLLRVTDILWTKPSELSFCCALGIPLIIAPPIGAHEKFNRKWLRDEIGAGISQEKPKYTSEWLFDYLASGRLAELAWTGFLKVRKLGTYNILDILKDGKMNNNNSLIH